MQVFHTAGVPPSLGRIILAIIGWTRNKSVALTNSVTAKRTGMRGNLSTPRSGGSAGIKGKLNLQDPRVERPPVIITGGHFEGQQQGVAGLRRVEHPVHPQPGR